MTKTTWTPFATQESEECGLNTMPVALCSMCWGVLGLVRYASNGDEVVTLKLRKQIAVSGLAENEREVISG